MDGCRNFASALVCNLRRAARVCSTSPHNLCKVQGARPCWKIGVFEFSSSGLGKESVEIQKSIAGFWGADIFKGYCWGLVTVSTVLPLHFWKLSENMFLLTFPSFCKTDCCAMLPDRTEKHCASTGFTGGFFRQTLLHLHSEHE